MNPTIHDDLTGQGWALTTEAELGLDSVQVMDSFEGALVPDPRGPGKFHARDVLSYRRSDTGAMIEAAECPSVAHTAADGTVVDDFARFALLEMPGAFDTLRAVLDLVPPPHRRAEGRISADYFSYSPGVGSAAHQDQFGDFVAIWCLDRAGDGGESFLRRDGAEVLRRALAPGEILAFRDELFLHGVEPMDASEAEPVGGPARRDVLIFITLRD